MQLEHDVAEERRRTGNPADLLHRLPVEIAHPDPHRIGGRIPGCPVVAEILGRPRLGGAGEGQVERTAEAEGRRPRMRVAEDVSDNESGAPGKGTETVQLPARPLFPLRQGFPGSLVAEKMDRAQKPAIGEGAISVGQLAQGDLAIAESQSRPVE